MQLGREIWFPVPVAWYTIVLFERLLHLTSGISSENGCRNNIHLSTFAIKQAKTQSSSYSVYTGHSWGFRICIPPSDKQAAYKVEYSGFRFRWNFVWSFLGTRIGLACSHSSEWSDLQILVNSHRFYSIMYDSLKCGKFEKLSERLADSKASHEE